MATIQGIYLALFGRPADPAGLAYFNGVTNNGADLSGIGDLAGENEYLDRFTGMSETQIINSIYQSLFGRDGEPAGISFWAEKLQTGELTINNIAIAILDGAQNSDKDTIDAKIAVADLFTTHLDLQVEQDAYVDTTNVALVKDFIAAINATNGSTEIEVDALIQRMLTSGGLEPGTGGGTGGGSTNVPATFVDSASATIKANGADPVKGTVTVTDTDGASTFSTADGDIAGKYGTFSFTSTDANGSWTYVLSEAGKKALLALNDEQSSSDSVTVTATDGTKHTITVAIDGVNEDPTVSDIVTAKTAQGAALTDIDVLSNVSDVDNGTVFSVSAIDGASVGTEFDVSSTTGSFSGKVTITADGKLAFTPGEDFNKLAAGASDMIKVSFTVSDGDGGTVANSVEITVNGINDAPTGADKDIDVLEDGSHTLSAADFGFSDIDGNGFAGVVITSVSGGGSIKLGETVITDGTTVAFADLGKLVFTPAADASGDEYASLGFKVYDDGGTDDGGADTAAVSSTITFNVTSVNDAPTGIDGTADIKEDQAYAFKSSDFGLKDAEGDALKAVIIGSLPAAGTLTLNGDALSAGSSVSLADIAAGKFVFTPAANANGTAYTSFDFKVQDDGGTDNGGQDTAASANTFTFNVAALDDAPTGADKAVTFKEDTAYTFSSSDFTLTDVDAPAHVLAAVIVRTLPALGTLTLDGAAVVEGTEIAAADLAKLKYTPVPDANGSAYSSFTFSLKDSGSSTDGNSNTETGTHTFTFNVTPVNDAPVISTSGDVVKSVTENNVATQIADINVADKDAGDTIKYELGGSDKGYFAIDKDGILTLKAGVDFEKLPAGDKVLDVTVTGTDSASATSNVLTFAVTITDDPSDNADPNDNDSNGLASNDTVEGNYRDNTLYGGAGKDALYGYGGNDKLYGGSGNDTLFGGPGNDKLYGGSGNDHLQGESGRDELYGGLGNDVFYFKAGDSTAYNTDTIMDWNKGDKIDLSAIDAKEWNFTEDDLVYGNQDNTPVYGQVNWYQAGGNTYVVANTSDMFGSDASLVIKIMGNVTLTADDFILS